MSDLWTDMVTLSTRDAVGGRWESVTFFEEPGSGDPVGVRRMVQTIVASIPGLTDVMNQRIIDTLRPQTIQGDTDDADNLINSILDLQVFLRTLEDHFIEADTAVCHRDVFRMIGEQLRRDDQAWAFDFEDSGIIHLHGMDIKPRNGIPLTEIWIYKSSLHNGMGVADLVMDGLGDLDTQTTVRYAIFKRLPVGLLRIRGLGEEE